MTTGRTATTLIAGAIAAMPVAALAQAEEHRIELAPWVGFVTGGTLTDEFTNQELELDDSAAAGIQLNIRAGHDTTWELHYARQETQTTNPDLPQVDVSVDRFQFGGTYEFNAEPTRPYAAATIGFSRFDPEDPMFEDDTYFSFSLGGGVEFFADRPVGLLVDVRWVGSLIDDDTDLFCVSDGGLTCLYKTESGLVSQFRLFAGLNVRF